MTVIWIAARSSHAVDWSKDLPLPLLSLGDAGEDEEEAALFAKIPSAQQELWLKLASGELKATAINAEGDLVGIDPFLWSRLSLKDRDEADFQHANKATLIAERSNMAFTDIEFLASDVVRLWPSEDAPAHMLREPSGAAGAVEPSSELKMAPSSDEQLPSLEATEHSAKANPKNAQPRADTHEASPTPPSMESIVAKLGGLQGLKPLQRAIYKCIGGNGGWDALPTSRECRHQWVKARIIGKKPGATSLDEFFSLMRANGLV